MRKFLLLKFVLLLAVGINSSWAQERTVSGKITAVDDGQPLPGVNVVLKGTTTGTVTDIDGNYKLTVPNDGGILVYSFIGLTTEEIAIGSRAVIDLQMTSDVTQLTEVVVTAFGVEREKKSLGYSVQEVKNDELTKTRQTNVLSSLQGKVAGAQISNAGGQIGASTRVVLRGPTSLLGNNEALFVVDGIPINNSTSANVQSSGNAFDNFVDGGNRANDINPEDIESVSILKGPSAAALYGSRAANGVVLITTKKGKNLGGKKKTEITFNTSYIWSNVLAIPRMQNRFGQGQFGNNQGFLNDQESWGDPFDGTLRPYGAIVNNEQRYKAYVAQPSNVEDFFETGTAFQNSISLNGGNENATYYLSFSDLDQTGTLPNTDYRRNNFTLNGSTKLTNNVTSSASINYVRVDGNLPQTGQRNQALAQIYNMPRDYSAVDWKDLSNPYNTPDGFFSPFIVNPYYSLNRDFSTQNMNRVYGNFQLNYKPVEWLTATARVGTDVISDNRDTYRDVVVYQTGSANNGAAFDADGEYTEQYIDSREINTDFLLSASKELTQDIQGTLLVGFNYNQRSAESLTSTATSLNLPQFPSMSNSSGTVQSTSALTKRRLMGLYSSLDLSYKGYLFLGATFRNDWSSTLPLDNNSFSYPGVSLGFVLTDAFDLGIDNVLSFAKFRASYAEVGNDATPYLTNSVFVQSAIGASFATLQFPFNDGTNTVTGFSEGNRIGNAKLQPEITKSYELGADFRFFNGRFNIDATYYNSLSEAQILNAAISPSTGYTTQVLNVGSIRNKGIELTVSGTPVKVGDFKWDLSVNFTKNVNKVEELNDGATQLTLLAQGLTPGLLIVEGQPYGVFEATQVLRDASGNIVVDPTGQPIDDPTPVQIGNIQPDWLGGLTSTLSWKGLSLSATLETRQGGNVVSSTAAQMYFAGIAEETAFNDRESYIIPGSVTQQIVDGNPVLDDQGNPVYVPNTVPLTMSGGGVRNIWSNVQGGSRNEEVLLDASFIKLREVAINYDLPKKLLEKTPFGSVRIGAIGRNLWMHTAKDNHFIDPEASAFGNGNVQGYESLGIPSQYSYGFNLRVTF